MLKNVFRILLQKLTSSSNSTATVQIGDKAEKTFSLSNKSGYLDMVEYMKDSTPPKRDISEIHFIWCLVGNVVDEHSFGVEKEIRMGTKHFSPGTKLYCFPIQWGDGYEKILVIGRPRRSRRFVKVVVKSDYLTNWRLEKVYSSFIIKAMIHNRGWDDSEKSKLTIQEMLEKHPAIRERRKL